MDTVDKAEVVVTEKKKPGRPKRQDPTTPMGDYIAESAKQNRERKSANRVVEKYYELSGKKLSLCKKNVNGSVFKTLVGTTNDPKQGPQLQVFVKKLQSEGKLRVKI